MTTLRSTHDTCPEGSMQRHPVLSRLGRALATVAALTCTLTCTLVAGTAAPAAAGDPILTVVSLSTGLCADGSLSNYATVVEEPCRHYSEQLWTIRIDDGALVFVNYHYDGCLDLVSPVGAGLVRQGDCSDQSSHWRYRNGSDVTTLPKPGNHIYQFINVQWNRCLQSGGGPNDALVALPCTGQRNQLWVVNY